MKQETFDGGPPTRLATWLRLRGANDPRVLRLIFGAVALAWVPMALLTGMRGDFARGSGTEAFVQDFAVHARTLIAIPLLILAESVCLPRLGAIARHFGVADLIQDSDRSRFDAALVSTRRLLESKSAEIAAAVCAYAIIFALAFSISRTQAPAWQIANGTGLARYSPAGWWHLLVSLPLLLVLVLGWSWRLFLWSRFLWLMSRLNLHLLCAHPDHAAGLMFAGYSVRAWALPALAPSVIVAGTLANRVVHDGASPLSFKFLVPGLAVCVVMIFTAPLVVFSRNLLLTWRAGVLSYSALAESVGHEFERQWIGQVPPADKPLQTGAFSATTDLYSIVANVYEMRFAPIDAQSVIFLTTVTLLPFLPVLLISEPLDVILKKAAGFFM